MVPRGSLSIHYSDIFYGFYAACRSSFEQSLQQNELICLSVRSGLDTVLKALNLPFGSEVIIGAVNIPGIFDIIRAHQLKVVALPVSRKDLSIDLQDFKDAITENTKVVVFTHLFGAIIELDPFVAIAKQNNLFIIEDCAQAFNGNYKGNPATDLCLFSFGMIKTNTASGGALLQFKSNELAKETSHIQNHLPSQRKSHFLKKLSIALLIKVLTNKWIYTLFFQLLLLLKKDPDLVISGFTRGFSGLNWIEKIRIKPSNALIKLVKYKLKNIDMLAISRRKFFAEEIYSQLPNDMKVGFQNKNHSFWVLPVKVANPEKLIRSLREAGFDATAKASSMICLKSNFKNINKADCLNLDEIVYLPLQPKINKTQKDKLTLIVKGFT